MTPLTKNQRFIWIALIFGEAIERELLNNPLIQTGNLKLIALTRKKGINAQIIKQSEVSWEPAVPTLVKWNAENGTRRSKFCPQDL